MFNIREPSPQSRKRLQNSEIKTVSTYQHASAKQFGGLNGFQQQIVFRDNVHGAGRKESRLMRSISSTNPFEDRNREGKEHCMHIKTKII